MRVAIGQIYHETNTFSAEWTNESSFRQSEWLEGQEIITAHEGVRDYIGGMIDEARLLDIELVPVFSAAAEPSGIIVEETWHKMKQRLMDLLMEAGELDGICLALHGAGISEECNDIEGELLSSVRAAAGTEIPLVATLDLHANMTPAMVEHADLLLGVNLYPHSDEYDRGREAIRRLREIARGTIRPRMHLERLPLMIQTSTTLFGPAAQVNQICWEWEKRTGMLDCTFYHGFPYTDAPDVGVSVLAVADGDEALALAAQAAQEAARAIWELRDEFNTAHVSPAEGLRMACESDQHPVIINETSDNPGAGTPGDGTYLLAELLRENVPGSCFCHICDPEVAEAAHRAGVGSQIDVELGGKTDDHHGSPLKISAYVKLLTDGEFTLTSPMGAGKKVCLGKSVRLRVGNVDVIVCSVKSQLLDDELLKLHGIDLLDYKMVGIKSSQHFRGFFQDRVPRIITVDSPGLSTFDYTRFNYRRVRRPIYPLDQTSYSGSKIE